VDKRYAQEEYSKKTQIEYNSHIQKHIIPVFGHKRLDEIKTKHIVDFIDDLKKPGGRKDGRSDNKLSSSTVLYIYKVLKSVLDRAAEWNMVKKNPITGVKQPTVERVKPQFFNEDEANQIIKALTTLTPTWRFYYLSCLLGGFRRGELLPLEWNDVDFDECTISIDKSLPIDRKFIDDPKNESSVGEVDMPEWFMLELKEFHEQWEKDKETVGDDWKGKDHEFVFHSGYGEPYYPSTATGTWTKFLKRNGIRHIKLHGLRHTSGSLLFEAGEQMKSIQERLRHSREQTTSDIYVHVTKKKKKQTANAFDKFNPNVIGTTLAPIDENEEPTMLQ
jgi:integrase